MIVNNSINRKLKSNTKLTSQVMDMAKHTALGELGWDILCSTSEYNDDKNYKIVDGKEYIEDECYVSYHTNYNQQEFLMITYENILTSGNEQKTVNMVYLPPLGNRFFDNDLLAPYAVETDQMLMYAIHELWKAILERKKHNNSELIEMVVERRSVK